MHQNVLVEISKYCCVLLCVVLLVHIKNSVEIMTWLFDCISMYLVPQQWGAIEFSVSDRTHFTPVSPCFWLIKSVSLSRWPIQLHKALGRELRFSIWGILQDKTLEETNTLCFSQARMQSTYMRRWQRVAHEDTGGLSSLNNTLLWVGGVCVWDRCFHVPQRTQCEG